MPTEERRMRIHDANSQKNPSLKKGLLGFSNAVGSNSWQIWQSFRSDLENRFRNTFLGLFWALFLPIVPISAYLFLRLVITNPSTAEGAVHPALYVAIGVTIWFAIVDTIMVPIRSMQSARGLATQDSIPLCVTILSFAGPILLDLAIRLALVAIVFLLLQGVPPWQAILTLPLLALCVAYALGIGVYLLFLQLIVPDSENIISIMLRYLIFVSLAIFPLGIVASGHWLFYVNPIAIVIENLRSLMTTGDLATPFAFILLNIVGLVLAIGAAYFIHITDTRIRSLL